MLGIGVSRTGKIAVTRQDIENGVGGDVFAFNNLEMNTISLKLPEQCRRGGLLKIEKKERWVYLMRQIKRRWCIGVN